MTARLATAALLVCASFATLASLLLPDPAPAHAVPTAPAAVVVHHAAHAGGTDVSGVLDELTADRGFLADLFDGAATDLDPQTAADLIATAHRICDSGQPRADWMASLTVGPHALTAGEAGKLLDTAEASFCPAQLAATYPGVTG